MQSACSQPAMKRKNGMAGIQAIRRWLVQPTHPASVIAGDSQENVVSNRRGTGCDTGELAEHKRQESKHL